MRDWEADVDDLDDIVHEFLVESHENLDQLDSDLVALEGAPGSRELLSSVFRTIHTIKGTSGFLAFSRLESLTHVGESLLVELRDGTRTMDQPTTDVLLRMVDKVRELLGRIEQVGAEGDIDVSEVVGALEAVLAGQAPAAQSRRPGRGRGARRQPPRKPRARSRWAPRAVPSPSYAHDPAPGRRLPRSRRACGTAARRPIAAPRPRARRAAGQPTAPAHLGPDRRGAASAPARRVVGRRHGPRARESHGHRDLDPGGP